MYELYVRTHYLLPPSRLTHYHKQVVAQVRAETQATHLKRLTPYLTDKEADMVRRDATQRLAALAAFPLSFINKQAV